MNILIFLGIRFNFGSLRMLDIDILVMMLIVYVNIYKNKNLFWIIFVNCIEKKLGEIMLFIMVISLVIIFLWNVNILIL